MPLRFFPKTLCFAASLLALSAMEKQGRAQAMTPEDSSPLHPLKSMWPSSPLDPDPSAPSAPVIHPELEQPPAEDPSAAPAPPSSNPENTSQASHFMFPGGKPEELSAHLLVVYNSRDGDSKALAQYYATRRHIPAVRVLGIPCSMNEEITRADYEATIREPIITYIFQNNWMDRRTDTVPLGQRTLQLLIATRNNIWAIVLMRGVPLKIAEDPTDHSRLEQTANFQTNAAAVDSELALLPVFGLPIGGFVPNIFFDGANTGQIRAGPELATKLILVTRLDGPTPGDVRRMIDDSLYAEKNRLAGLAVVDSLGITNPVDGYIQGDIWMRGARDTLIQQGWLTYFDDQNAVLPPSDPCNHVALYFGWYHDGAYGPWVTPPNRFVRGAIAYHIHSFSAATVRSDTAAWVGPLIAHGAAATMGTVYEPYLDMTPHVDIFTKRILAGNYFAEAAYASQRGLSWMGTVVGDPLYRPFRLPLDSALTKPAAPGSGHYDWMLLEQVQRATQNGQIASTPENLERYLNIPGAVAQEGLGDLLEKWHDPAARMESEQAYERAAQLNTLPVDCIRIKLKLAREYTDDSKSERAQDEMREIRENYPLDASRFGVGDPRVSKEAIPAVTERERARVPSPSNSLTPPKPPGPPMPTSP